MAKKITLEQFIASDNAESLLSKLSFEDGLALLEELVGKVESGSLSLDNAMLSYEKGSKLIDQLRGLLSGAEEKLKILSATKG